MGPLRYALCQNSILGPIMWILFACGFPPVLKPTEVSFSTNDIILDREFSIKVPLHYKLVQSIEFSKEDLTLAKKLFPDSSRYKNESWEIYDDKEDSDIPEDIKSRMGVRNKFEITIYKKSDNTVLFNKIMTSAGKDSAGENNRSRHLSLLPLEKGDYRMTIRNLKIVPEYAQFKNTFMIVKSGPSK